MEIEKKDGTKEEKTPLLSQKQGTQESSVESTQWVQFLLPFFWGIPDNGKIYCNFTRIKPSLHEVVCVVYVLDLIWWWKNVAPFLEGKFVLLKPIFTLFWFLAIFSYEITRFRNPGYLPYNWSETKKNKFTTQELRDGIAIHADQIQYAKTHDVPHRSWFSNKTGYFIMRADHDCGWLGAWVGLRNHRYFIMGLIYGTIAISIWFVTGVYVIYKGHIVSSWTFTIPLFLFSFPVTCINILQAHTQITNLCRNIIFTEVLLNRAGMYSSGSKLEGWIEICGPLKWILCWPCPVPLPESTDGISYAPNPNWVPPPLPQKPEPTDENAKQTDPMKFLSAPPFL